MLGGWLSTDGISQRFDGFAADIGSDQRHVANAVKLILRCTSLTPICSGHWESNERFPVLVKRAAPSAPSPLECWGAADGVESVGPFFGRFALLGQPLIELRPRTLGQVNEAQAGATRVIHPRDLHFRFERSAGPG